MEEVADPPEHLDADAAAIWRRLAPQLVEVGLLDRLDLTALEHLCRAEARVRQFGRVVAKEGAFALGSRSQITQAAWVRAERAAAAECRAMWARFGLSPVDRTRLGLMNLAGRSMLADLDREIGGSGEVIDVDADDFALPPGL